MGNRVVVTGCGVISPVGQTADSYWSSLTRGVCGIARATLVDADKLNQKIVAEVKGFDPHSFFDDRQLAALEIGRASCRERV